VLSRFWEISRLRFAETADLAITEVLEKINEVTRAASCFPQKTKTASDPRLCPSKL